MAEPYTLRTPCKHCGGTAGHIETKSGQDCVYCDRCGRHAYNAPRTETGKRQRSVSTVHAGIKPRTRYLVMERARQRCEVCGADTMETVGHLAHFVSVANGLEDGLTDAELNSLDNLYWACEECNLGQGALNIHPLLLMALMRRRLRTPKPVDQ